LGHDVATLYRDYARVIAELDPDDKTTATARITAARRKQQGTSKAQPKRTPAKRARPRKQKTAHLQAV
jgi:hypothetical protein